MANVPLADPGRWLSPSGRSLILVAIAAALVGTEGLLRRPLLDEMPVASIVLAEQLLLALFAVPVAIAHRRVLARLPLRRWGVLFLIGVGASGSAALLFTKALELGSPTTASLLQSSQPLFVVFLAMAFLKERLIAPLLALSRRLDYRRIPVVVRHTEHRRGDRSRRSPRGWMRSRRRRVVGGRDGDGPVGAGGPLLCHAHRDAHLVRPSVSLGCRALGRYCW